MVRLERLDVMTSVWEPDRSERTHVGELIRAAKERSDRAAIASLVQEARQWATSLDLELDADTLVVPIPSSPDRPNLLVPAVAAALGQQWGKAVGAVVERHAVTPRLRDLELGERPGVAAAGDYRFVGDAAVSSIILVDDVVLTGTTLDHVSGILRTAGVERVMAVVLARSRRG